MSNLSFRASRRLSNLADEAAEQAAEQVPESEISVTETYAHDLVIQDELVGDALEAEYRADQQAHSRRKAIREDGRNPRDDAVLTQLQSARQSARKAAEQRVEELVAEAVEADLPSGSANETVTYEEGSA